MQRITSRDELLDQFGVKIIPENVISNLLRNRLFQIFVNDTRSNRKLNNGLPQDSVLVSLLFNLYTAVLPKTSLRLMITLRPEEFNGRVLNHSGSPKYLGVTLHWTLKFNLHLINVVDKLRSHNNRIAKLAGTTCNIHRSGCAWTKRWGRLLVLYYHAGFQCSVISQHQIIDELLLSSGKYRKLKANTDLPIYRYPTSNQDTQLFS